MPQSHRVQPGDPPISPKSGEDADLTQSESDLAQPAGEDGVTEDMGTLALHPGILEPAQARPDSAALVATDLTPEQVEARRAAVARGDFSLLTDAEVMLELKAGNMDAFDVLLNKYRKPIVHFMFRMVHN